MQIYTDLSQFCAGCRTAVTIGKFDGLHLGHQKLIRSTVDAARERREAGGDALSVVLMVGGSSQRLLSEEERRELLTGMGVDVLIEQRIDGSFARTEAETFAVSVLAGRLKAFRVIVGEDFRFGFRRQGDVSLLAACGSERGYETLVVPAVRSGGQKVSSTRVREAVLAGRMEETRALLGYPYYFSGEVVHGKALGRTIGVPTANLGAGSGKILPPLGVYYTRSLIDGSWHPGMTNVGDNPTVRDREIRVETHLFGFDGDLYGKRMRVELLHFARPEVKYPSVEALKAQLAEDREKGISFFLLDRDDRPCYTSDCCT